MTDRKTYILDIDGTLLYHVGDFSYIRDYKALKALPGARDKTMKWHCDGHMIIIMTARPECLRQITIEHLDNAGILWDTLIMGVGQGKRILVNDFESGTTPKAEAWDVLRNVDGIEGVE